MNKDYVSTSALYGPYLAHHGIKGQKWGVRNGPPYPLDSDIHSSIEKKSINIDKDALKKIAIYGAIGVGAALAVYGGYKLYSNGALSSVISGKPPLRLLDHAETSEESLKNVNPGRIRHLSSRKNLQIIHGSSQNCMSCTAAYDMRQRGYDVHAAFMKEGTLPEKFFPQMYKDYTGTIKIDRPGSADSLSNFLKQTYPSGSRGNMMVWWEGPFGGHSMVWEHTSDGSIRFLDAQTGEIYSPERFHTIYSMVGSMKPVEILRTDNLEINTDFVQKFFNTDTTTTTYLKHSPEIVASLLTKTPEGLAVLAGGAVAADKAMKNSYEKKSGEPVT